MVLIIAIIYIFLSGVIYLITIQNYFQKILRPPLKKSYKIQKLQVPHFLPKLTIYLSEFSYSNMGSII